MSLRRKIALALLAVMLLVPSATLYFVATTETGLQYVAKRLNGKLGPVTLTIGSVHGTLVKGFQVDRLRIEHRLSDVFIENASGSVQLLPLLILQRINLPAIEVGKVTVKLLSDPEKHEPRTPRFLPSLLRIDAASVHTADVDLILLNGRLLHATNVRGAAIVLPTQVRVRESVLDFEQAHIQATGRVLAAIPIGLEGDVDVVYRPTNQPEWAVTAQFDGNLDKLPLTTQISRPFHAITQGAATTLNAGWKYAGHAEVKDFDVRAFGGGNALGIISGALDITADGDGFTARGALTPPGLKAGAFNVDFRGTYHDKELTILSASAVHPGSGARATVSGTVGIVPNGPQLGIRGEWTNFRWPLAARDPAFTSPRGSYSMNGVKPWQVQAAGDVVTADVPTIPVQMTGRLGTEVLQIDSGTAQVYGGTARISGGEARWQPAESWRVTGRMSDLDTTQLRADLPGKLNFDFTAAGAPFGEAGTIDFDMANLSGKLRSQNASGKGHFARAAHSTDWQFRGVDVRLGNTRVQLDGGLGAQRDLTFAVDADDLSLFDAEAKGRISARGRYAGTEAAPLLLFKARGSGFEWKGSKLAGLDADVDMDFGATGHAQGKVALTGLTVGSRTAQSATIELAGTGAQHRIALDIEAAPLRTAMSLQGAWVDGLWQGAVQSLRVDDGRDLTLTLEAPAALRANLEQVELEQLCLKGGDGRLCSAGRLLPDGNWTARFSADALPLRALTAGLSQDIDYEGTIKLQGDLAGGRNVLPTGSVKGELTQALLRHRLGNGRDERMALGSGSFAANATATSFALQVGLDAGASGKIEGELTGERTAGAWTEYPIRGKLDAATDGLALLDIYVGGIDKATGRLATQVSIAGTLGRPVVEGKLQLREAAIDVFQVNLAMRELSMDASFDADNLTLSGQSKLGNGLAHFNGTLEWRKGEPYGNLHVDGENLRIVDVPEARIEASPKLEFKLTGHRIDATGEVNVPYAKLEPADLTNAVLSSSDEVLVGAPVVDPSQRWLVVSDIRIALGDAVNINSLGLIARLGGSISVRTDESQVSRGQGELNIAEGKYAAFGRLLDIERGRLIFNNVPLGDPGVDLRAQKVYTDITAGINVRGSLRAPRMTFFSEPAIPQSQIASLILAGGSLESIQNTQRSGAARNDILAQGGAILAQRVGSRVGVDDVGIESDLNNDTALVVGKYLAPRLYVSYGISLAEAINTLKLRYTIGDHWTIKTEAGKERSADIVYTIQK